MPEAFNHVPKAFNNTAEAYNHVCCNENYRLAWPQPSQKQNPTKASNLWPQNSGRSNAWLPTDLFPRSGNRSSQRQLLLAGGNGSGESSIEDLSLGGMARGPGREERAPSTKSRSKQNVSTDHRPNGKGPKINKDNGHSRKNVRDTSKDNSKPIDRDIWNTDTNQENLRKAINETREASRRASSPEKRRKPQNTDINQGNLLQAIRDTRDASRQASSPEKKSNLRSISLPDYSQRVSPSRKRDSSAQNKTKRNVSQQQHVNENMSRAQNVIVRPPKTGISKTVLTRPGNPGMFKSGQSKKESSRGEISRPQTAMVRPSNTKATNIIRQPIQISNNGNKSRKVGNAMGPDSPAHSKQNTEMSNVRGLDMRGVSNRGVDIGGTSGRGDDVRRFDNRGGVIANMNDTLTTITSHDTVSDEQGGDVEYLGRSKAGSEDEDEDDDGGSASEISDQSDDSLSTKSSRIVPSRSRTGSKSRNTHHDENSTNDEVERDREDAISYTGSGRSRHQRSQSGQGLRQSSRSSRSRSSKRPSKKYGTENIGPPGTSYALWTAKRHIQRDHKRRFNRSLCGVLLGVSIVLVILGILGIIGIAVYLGGN